MTKKMLFFAIPLFIILLLLSCTKKPAQRDNLYPIINSIEASPNIVFKEGVVYLNLAVTDPDEDKMYFEWSCSQGQGEFFADETLNTASNTANPCWWKPPAVESNYKISVTCTDSIGDTPGFVDTNVTVSVSIYSLDTIIGEDEFSSPFSMYLDDAGKMYLTDPGLSAIHYYNGTRWISWNYFGLDTTINITTTYDTTFEIDSTDTTILFIDTTKVVETFIGKDLYDSPSAISVDENMNFVYVANVKLDSTVMSIYDFDKMFTSEDTVTALSTVVTMSTDSGSGVWDTLTDTLLLDTVCLYGYQFRQNDRSDLNSRIKSPYSSVIDPSSQWLYISTEISIVAYDTTWSTDGWKKYWSMSIAKNQINYKGRGLKLFDGDLYLASFGVKKDTVHSLIRRFTDIENPGVPPTEVFEISSDNDTTLQYVSGIAIAQDGHIFVTEGGGSEKSYHRVVEYDEKGDYVRSFGSLGGGDDQFNFPTDIFIDSEGRIYVVDMGNACIKVFKK
ncbi:MAG: hypothetical protein E3J87_04445 [Candidatus Cloacimonadota bacterium]|nr:MAG: hypothetical protein E3J87_04445 [Candidatus Cloacimonadota bacterium]